MDGSHTLHTLELWGSRFDFYNNDFEIGDSL